MLKTSIPFAIKPLALATVVAFGLAGCGTEGKPKIPYNPKTESGSSGSGGTTSNFRVRASVVADNVEEPTTGTAKATFRAIYVHKENLEVADKYTADSDITVDYKLGCDANVTNGAVAGVDFKGNTSGSVVLPKGKNTVDIPVEILHNPAPTENRKLCFEITNLTDKNMLDDETVRRKMNITIANIDVGASIQSAAATNGDASVKVMVTASQKLKADTDVYFEVVNGSAVAGTHFKKPTSDKITIKKGENSAEINIPLLTTEISNDVKFEVKLVNKTGGLASIATKNNASVIISAPKPSEPAKRGKVNGTGVSFSGKEKADDTTCTDNRQDCQNKSPMQFTKLDKDGKVLASTATEWACFKDETTGLVWETKTYTPKIAGKYGAQADINKNHRDIELSDWTYRNSYQKLGVSDTGEGSAKDNCRLDDKVCTTESYTKKINAEQLCGVNNWRLPTRHELFNIFNLNDKPTLPTTYLINHNDTKIIPFSFWTQSLALNNGKLDKIWVVYNDGTFSTEDPKSAWSTAAILAVSNGK
ncbi:hypothetical protein MOMA_02395 [Moraxella macacae 0408225]|uniref:Calx-beta domain-containing protein n=1 Tax=Moraxella macacae 0408225 TaxID=1230338 RepID=L2F9S2_9GAMM|nr:DUF1566 domain-containing protein [Moraxella macacae]ELA09218.1 hypothetical protein MOMA_02395 [Moraxella macacae 0408225]